MILRLTALRSPELRNYEIVKFATNLWLNHPREMVRKLGRVLYCMFLFAILGDDPAKKPIKIPKTVNCAHTTNL